MIHSPKITKEQFTTILDRADVISERVHAVFGQICRVELIAVRVDGRDLFFIVEEALQDYACEFAQAVAMKAVAVAYLCYDNAADAQLQMMSYVLRTVIPAI